MAGMLGGVVIQFKAKADRATRDIGKLTRALGDVDKKARGAGGGMSKWAKAATAGVAAVGAVGIVAADAFVDMAKAAYADKQAQDKMVRTIDRVKGVTTKAAQATGDWVDRMELLTLISDDDLRKALSRLTPITGDLTEAQKLAALAADASVASGKSYTAVVEAMAKAAGGNTAALKKLFPQLDAGPDKVLTLSEAVDQLTGSYGGAAKAAADNDLFGRLSTAFGQIKEAVGGVALPVLEELAGWLSDKKNIAGLETWIGKLEEWSTTVGEDLLGRLKEFVTWLSTPANQQAIKDWIASLQQWADVIGTVITQLGTLYDLLMKLPGNQILQWLGLIPDLTPGSGATATAPASGSRASGYTGGYTNSPTINIYNPKPEKASASVAAGQRLARNTGRGD